MHPCMLDVMATHSMNSGEKTIIDDKWKNPQGVETKWHNHVNSKTSDNLIDFQSIINCTMNSLTGVKTDSVFMDLLGLMFQLPL